MLPNFWIKNGVLTICAWCCIDQKGIPDYEKRDRNSKTICENEGFSHYSHGKCIQCDKKI